MAISINGSGTITGISSGGLNDGIITQDELVTAVTPIGVGQTWQDVTASRANGVTYTNSTGQPILICFHSTEGGTATLTVGGIVLNRASNNLWYSAIVPAATTYVFSGNFTVWAELR